MSKKAYYNIKYGLLEIEYEEDVVTAISLMYCVEAMNEADNNPSYLTDKVCEQIVEYIEGKRRNFDFPYEFKIGTDFQKKVWRALVDIPYGETRSYKDIAIAVGNPKASRAVGGANNKNPIGIVVP